MGCWEEFKEGQLEGAGEKERMGQSIISVFQYKNNKVHKRFYIKKYLSPQVRDMRRTLFPS